jgi:hypothetical protein
MDLDPEVQITNTPNTGGTKRQLADRSPETAEPIRANKQTKLDYMGLCRKAQTNLDDLRRQVTMTTLAVNDKTSWKEAKDKFLGLFTKVVDSMDVNMNVVSDMAAGIGNYQEEIETKDRKISELHEKVIQLERRKDSQDIKESQDIMAGEIRQAMTQFKVLDLDIGKETEDRQEIVKEAAKALNERIRSDVKEKWQGATRQAKIIPVGRKTTKRQVDGKDIHTVPVLIKIDDKDDRWQAEEALRKSNVFPAFHWPQAMLPYIRQFRKDMVDNGIDENNNYIRIRPEDRLGKLRIRGDAKAKDNGKFETRAYWNVPTADVTKVVNNPELVKIQMVARNKLAPAAYLTRFLWVSRKTNSAPDRKSFLQQSPTV